MAIQRSPRSRRRSGGRQVLDARRRGGDVETTVRSPSAREALRRVMGGGTDCSPTAWPPVSRAVRSLVEEATMEMASRRITSHRAPA